MPNRTAALEGLRLLCTLLSPFSTREQLLADWPPAPPWKDMLAEADYHRLVPALSVALDRHRLGDRIDAELADVLAAVAAWNTERNQGFRRQMRVLSGAFNAAGLTPIWLKGALSLLPPDGPARGRQMMDLDVWLPQESGQRAAIGVLKSLGYASEDGDWEEKKHFPPFFHPDEMARVELHRTIVDPGDPLLPPAEAAAAVEWLDWEGVRIGRLDPLSRALCSLAQCTSSPEDLLYASKIPLLKALDFVDRIHGDFGGAVPPALVTRVQEAGWEPSTRRFLTLTQALFGLPNPLPADPALLQGLEFFTLYPRRHHMRRALRTAFGTGGAGLFRQPMSLPGRMSRLVARLIAPNAPRID